MKKKIFISGPMSGIKDNNIHAFNEKERELLSEGHDVMNPASHGTDETKSWLDYMIDDLRMLSECTHIHFLDGWEESAGAQIEALAAKRMGIEIHDPDTLI